MDIFRLNGHEDIFKYHCVSHHEYFNLRNLTTYHYNISKRYNKIRIISKPKL